MIPVRLYQERPQSTMSGLNAPDGAGCFPTERWSDELPQESCLNAPGGAGCFPTPRRVVRCPAWGNGPRIATGLKAPLDRVAHRPLKQTLPSSRKGRHRRTCWGSAPPGCRRGHADPAAVPCSSNTSVQTRATNREALARRPPGGRRRASSQDWAPQPFPLGEATTVPPQGPWWPGWWVWPAWRGCYRRDRVVSMESASLTRRPRVRVTDVIGSAPIAWNSLSVRSPVGA